MNEYVQLGIYLAVSAAVGWAARHLGLGAPKVVPSDVPPIPTSMGHGEVVTWLAKLAVAIAKEQQNTPKP